MKVHACKNHKFRLFLDAFSVNFNTLVVVSDRYSSDCTNKLHHLIYKKNMSLLKELECTVVI